MFFVVVWLFFLSPPPPPPFFFLNKLTRSSKVKTKYDSATQGRQVDHLHPQQHSQCTCICGERLKTIEV